MAVPRMGMDGIRKENEPVNKSQIYINLVSIIAKKLAKANFQNCWEAYKGNQHPKY